MGDEIAGPSCQFTWQMGLYPFWLHRAATSQQGPLTMPYFAKYFVYWIIICLLLLLQLCKLLWTDIESSVGINLPQDGHVQADFGDHDHQPHTKLTAAGLLRFRVAHYDPLHKIPIQDVALYDSPHRVSIQVVTHK